MLLRVRYDVVSAQSIREDATSFWKAFAGRFLICQHLLRAFAQVDYKRYLLALLFLPLRLRVV